MARVLKLTPMMQSQFCAMVQAGCSRRAAARLLGVPESTVRKATYRDEGFAESVRKSEMVRELAPLNHLRAAGEKNWRAAAWFLERLQPNDYGRRDPEMVSEVQLASTLDQFAETLMSNISLREDRQKVVDAIQAMAADLERRAEPWNEPVLRKAPRIRNAPAAEKRKTLNDERGAMK